MAAVQRLVKYNAPKEHFPVIRRAAVCCCLFAGERAMNARAMLIRVYQGDLASYSYYLASV